MSGSLAKSALTTATVVLCGVALSGCVTTAETQRYYPPGSSSAWQIDGDMKGLTGEMHILINDKLIMQGEFPSIVKKYSMSGNYRNLPMKADCEIVYCTNSVACFVYVDQEPAALLEFGKP